MVNWKKLPLFSIGTTWCRYKNYHLKCSARCTSKVTLNFQITSNAKEKMLLLTHAHFNVWWLIKHAVQCSGKNIYKSRNLTWIESVRPFFTVCLRVLNVFILTQLHFHKWKILFSARSESGSRFQTFPLHLFTKDRQYLKSRIQTFFSTA